MKSSKKSYAVFKLDVICMTHSVVHLARRQGAVAKGQLFISLFSIKPHFFLNTLRAGVRYICTWILA